jgi:phage baseplate assembly protein V
MGLKHGVVKEVDAAGARVRVEFPGDDGMASGWLQVTSSGSGANRFYELPDTGTQVACLLDERGEGGVVIGATFSTADPPPSQSIDKTHIVWADGAEILYDRAASVLTVKTPGKVIVEAGGGVLITGDVTIKGALSASGAGQVGGSLSVSGDVNAGGSVIDGGGNTNHHSH